MSCTCYTESLFCAFLEVTTATAMDMHLYATGNYVHALGIDDIGTDDGKIAIGNFKYLIVSQDDAAIL